MLRRGHRTLAPIVRIQKTTYPGMKAQTHYATLGLDPNAPQEVIRAAYRALALTYQPDKTLEPAAAERAARAMVLSILQEAFDVLDDQNHKVAYDAELARNDGGIIDQVSAFHHYARPTLTTQGQESSMRARAQQQLQYWKVLREKRQEAEACLSVAELASLVKIWGDLENENAADASMKARCTILAHEYLVEIHIREQDHRKSLEKASRYDHTPATPTMPVAVDHHLVTPNAPTKSTTAVPAPSPNISDMAAQCTRSDISPMPTPFSRLNARAAERKRVEEKRAEEAKARAEARKKKKVQLEAAKQTHLQEKAAFVRAEKARQKAIAEDQACAKAEHIAKVRAKVRGVPIGFDTVDDDFVASGVQGDSLSHGIDASEGCM